MATGYVDEFQVRQQARETWTSKPHVREEFNGDFRGYQAYQVANAKGLVRVHGSGGTVTGAPASSRAPSQAGQPSNGGAGARFEQSSAYMNVMRRHIHQQRAQANGAGIKSWLDADEPTQKFIAPMSRRAYFASFGLIVDDDGNIEGA